MKDWREMAAKHEKEQARENRQKASEYLSRHQRRNTFDWGKLFEKKEELGYSGRRIFSDLWDASLDVLRELEVLVYPRENSFFPMGDGINLSPISSGGTRYHFSEEKEAEKYAKAKYERALYCVSVCELKRNSVNKN